MSELQNSANKNIAHLVDEQMESRVIGILLGFSAVHREILPMLKKDDFSVIDYRNTFIVMESLLDKKTQSDLVSVRKEASRLGLGIDMLKLVKTTQEVVSGANIQQFALALVEMRMRRELYALATEIARRSKDLKIDVLQTSSEISNKLKSLISLSGNNKIIKLEDLFNQSLKNIENPEEELLLSSFSLKTVTERVIGMLAGNITIYAGRPGSGKTTLLMQDLWHASFKTPVALVSIEQTALEIMYRMISSQTGIPMNRIIKRELEKGELELIRTLKDHFKRNIYIIEDAYTLSAISTSLIRLFEMHGVVIWGLDYIQLVKHQSVYKSKNNSVEEVSAQLKYLAKSHLNHGLVLSQLGRDGEKGTEIRRPRLSDLRDSGAIEQDATTVIFIHRPEAQGVLRTKDGESLEGKAEIIIAKNRNGKLDIIEVSFDGNKYNFSEEIKPNMSKLFNTDDDAPY